MLVNQMVPLTPKGSSNWFIDEVNAAISQGKVCVGFQWIAAMGGLLDPASSELGKTKEEILEKLAFAPLPKQDTDHVPLGGMGLHISKYIPEEKQAEALNFIKWFQTPEAQKKWAQLGGVPARNDVLSSPEFLEAQPYNYVFTESVPRLKDFWNLPGVREAPERPLDAGQRRDLRHPGARRGAGQAGRGRAGDPRRERRVSSAAPRGRAVCGPASRRFDITTWPTRFKHLPRHRRPPDRLEAPPAARRFRWLTDRRLAALFVSPALALLIFLSIWPLIWLILAVVHGLLGDPRRRLRT